MDNCYITSTRTTHKHRRNEIIGPCGPCSFINLVKLKGSFKLEKKLAQMGRLRPFYASDFTSFLIWAEHFKKKIEVYTQNLNISSGTFKMMFKYEKIPKGKQKKLRDECLNRHNEIVQRNKNRIHLLRGNPLKTINFLLSRGYSVVFHMADYFDKDFLIGHLRVCYKKLGPIYFIKDSREGILKFTRKEMLNQLANLEKMGGTADLVGYKN